MKNYISLKFLLSLVVFFVGMQMLIAQPQDNPYRTRYQPDGMHWTDSIAWTNITDATTVTGLIDANSNVDSLTLQQTMANMSAAGGGVLYFPAGTYNFSYHLYLHSKVVIRGAQPTGIVNGLDSGYAPPTKFEFPQYVPTFSGAGTPNSTAFKRITADTNGIMQSGIVNIDINRAVVLITGSDMRSNPASSNPLHSYLARLSHSVMVFGCRINNGALPDPGVPTTKQITNNGEWVRWPWRFKSMVNLYVLRNGVVANCRINDNVTDNFEQPSYVLNDGSNVGATNGHRALFEYTDGYGIVINRLKVDLSGFSTYAGGPHADYALYGEPPYVRGPHQDPTFFRPGNEIRDNYVKTTTRVKIHAAGDGIVIDGNHCDDHKVTKNEYLTESGTSYQNNNSATYENRGIDVSGWNCLLTNNKIYVKKGRFISGYPTIDGEGILVQECCGGTKIYNYQFKHNQILSSGTGYIGIWKKRDLHQVYIDSNDLNGHPIFCLANTNGGDYEIHNSTIVGNTSVSSIALGGDAGGSNFLVADNVGTGSGKISNPPCAYITLTNNANFTVDSCTNAPLLTPPTVAITAPAYGTEFTPGQPFDITYTHTNGTDVTLYMGANIMSTLPVATTTHSTTAPMVPGNYWLRAEIKETGQPDGNSEPVLIKVKAPAPTGVSPKISSEQPTLFKVFPNPVQGLVQIDARFEKFENTQAIIYAIDGKKVKTVNLGSQKDINTMIDLSELKTGTYILQLNRKGVPNNTIISVQ